MRRRGQRGIFLITFAIFAVLLLGAGGAALDAGRLFVNRNEAQAYADAAALSAARKLDGTAGGLLAAREAVKSGANGWDFGTREVEDAALEFSTAKAPESWIAEPQAASGYTRVRVTAQVNQRLFFAPLFLVRHLQLVRVRATAEQARALSFKQGLAPFTVTALEGQAAPHFGLRPGESYAIRYGSSGGCRGDSRPSAPTWWGRSSDSVLRERILGGAQDASELTAAGKPFPEVSATPDAAREFLEIRLGQDTGSAAGDYASYAAANEGNGRRLMVLPIQDPSSATVRGFGMFFLLPLPEESGQPWCAEYTGKAFLPNSSRPGAGEPGAYAVRLVR